MDCGASFSGFDVRDVTCLFSIYFLSYKTKAKLAGSRLRDEEKNITIDI